MVTTASADLSSAPTPSGRARLKRWRRQAGKHLAGWFGRPILGKLARTWQLERSGEEHLARASDGGRRGYFMALWHGRMIVALPLPGHAHSGYHVLVSQSGDGDISERLLRAFGYAVIRGSSSRGGARSLREMLSVLRAGHPLVITPDGPRGPRHSMNLGLAWMARATGHPIVPCGFAAEPAWRLSSWDRFTIPKRGARVACVYEKPLVVGREGGDAALADATEEVRRRLLRAERRAAARIGAEEDF